jgi:hypothetical protein
MKKEPDCLVRGFLASELKLRVSGFPGFLLNFGFFGPLVVSSAEIRMA